MISAPLMGYRSYRSAHHCLKAYSFFIQDAIISASQFLYGLSLNILSLLSDFFSIRTNSSHIIIVYGRKVISRDSLVLYKWIYTTCKTLLQISFTNIYLIPPDHSGYFLQFDLVFHCILFPELLLSELPAE